MNFSADGTPVSEKKPKKSSFTGTNKKTDSEMELIEDLDELDTNAIRNMLIKSKIINNKEE